MRARGLSGRTVRTKYQGTSRKKRASWEVHGAKAGGVQWGVVATFLIQTQIKGTLVMSLLNGICGKACARVSWLDRSAVA